MAKKIIALVSAFLAVLLLSLYITNPLTGEEQSETLQFMGRFHPVVLHLPIGFFVLLVTFEFVSLFPFASKLKASTPIILVSTILATLLGVFTGMILAYASGSLEPLVVSHMRTSLVLGILALALGVLKLYALKWPVISAYRIVLLIALGVLVIASHNGGSITHGEDYLTRYMPNSMRPLFGLEIEESVEVAAVEDLVVYRNVLHHIFEQNCNSCHNPNKKKGDLNMETYAGLLEGGDMGYSIAPGDREDSELYFRITLPHDDEDFMPTDGKPPLSDTEVALIGWWIDSGADPEKTVRDHDAIPETILAYIGEDLLDSAVSNEELVARDEKRKDLYTELANLRDELGIIIIPVEPESTQVTVETFAVQKSFDDQTLQQLLPFAQNIVAVDFSSTALTDNALNTLAEFKNLRSLNLSKTAIRGTKLGSLSQLENLESLNLYGNPLEEACVDAISQLTQLKHLYLFQTDLYTTETIAQLKESLPNCEFVLN